MEEKNSAVELNNKLRQELVSSSLAFFAITQTVNRLKCNFVTFDCGLHLAFVSRLDKVVHFSTDQFQIVPWFLQSFLYSCFTWATCSLVLFVSYTSLICVLFWVLFAFHDSKCRTTYVDSHDRFIHFYKACFYLMKCKLISLDQQLYQIICLSSVQKLYL